MQAVPLGRSVGCDTDAKLTATSARAIRAATHNGAPIEFVARYVGISSEGKGDLDPEETSAILAAGLLLLVVQHVRMPGWTASGQLGALDGGFAARNAVLAGYPPGMLDADGRALSLVLDLEGVRNSGADVADHCNEWARVVRGVGYSPVLYVGYACGLTPAELYALPGFDRYWSDAGPRSVTTRSFAMKQGPTVNAGGVRVDIDVAGPDELGGTLTALGA